MKVKLNEEIKEYCRILKLNGIRDNFEEVMKESDDYEDFLHKLLEREMEQRMDEHWNVVFVMLNFHILNT